jgi:predicted phosphodiesterase
VRVACLYDIHGNLPALDAVLAQVPGDAAVLVGGDVFAGPMPTDVLQRLRALGGRARFVRGNADRFDAPADGELGRRRRDWVWERLSVADQEAVASWPLTDVLEVDGLGPTLFCHGSPRSDEEMVTAVTSEERLRAILAEIEERTVVCGHTHHQFDRTVDGIRVVNAGSIGMPYEGPPGAYWALLGPDVELRRTEYDLGAAAEAIRATDYPDPEEKIELLTSPPTADEVAELFERRALEQPA